MDHLDGAGKAVELFRRGADGSTCRIDEDGADAFARCQVRKVFKAVCLREPEDQTDRDAVDTITAAFVASPVGQGGSLKQVFADTAVHCMGQ